MQSVHNSSSTVYSQTFENRSSKSPSNLFIPFFASFFPKTKAFLWSFMHLEHKKQISLCRDCEGRKGPWFLSRFFAAFYISFTSFCYWANKWTLSRGSFNWKECFLYIAYLNIHIRFALHSPEKSTQKIRGRKIPPKEKRFLLKGAEEEFL